MPLSSVTTRRRALGLSFVSSFVSLSSLAILSALGIGCSRDLPSPVPTAAAAAASVPVGPRIVRFDRDVLVRLGLEVETAGSTGETHRLQVPGTLEYDLERYAEVGTLVEGRVATLAVKVGDSVKKGDPLATVIVPSLAAAQAEYVASAAAAGVARDHAAREARLAEQSLTTARENEAAQGDLRKADAQLAAARAKLSVLGAPLPSKAGGIASVGALTLASPLSGVVVRRDAVLGRFLSPQETAFVVADPTRLWATLEVYESDLPYFRKGSEVVVSVDAHPGETWTGKITLVEPHVGNHSRVLRARVPIDNTSGKLRPGLFLRASIELPESLVAARLLVPAEAVQPLGDGDVVFVEKAPGSFEIRRVELGRRSAEVVEIREGVSRGEALVVRGAFLLRGEATKQ